jgi:hypothetical protein
LQSEKQTNMPPLKDITGQHFGRLVVKCRAEGKGRPAWQCHCDCGKQCIVVGEDLRGGKTRSCGCLRAEASRKCNDLTEATFGLWGVIERAGASSSGEVLWLCVCNGCGIERRVRSSQLTWGRSLSCGCNRGGKLRRT